MPLSRSQCQDGKRQGRLGSDAAEAHTGFCLPLDTHLAQERKVRTQLWMGALQTGHSSRAGAHSVQTMWPQGTKTTCTARSRHTLQVRSSRRRCSCSSASWALGARGPGGTFGALIPPGSSKRAGL